MSPVKIAHELFNEKTKLASFLKLKDSKVFEYEYLNYNSEKHVYVTAKNNQDQIVGSQAFMPYVLNINGQNVLTGRSERTMVGVNYRGLNIFSLLYEECIKKGAKKGLQFIWGTTTAVKPFKKVGFVFHHGYWEHSLCCINTHKLISNIIKKNDNITLKFKIAMLLTAPLSLLLRFTFVLIFQKLKKSLIIHEQLIDPSDMRNIYDALREKGPLVSLVQDEQFIKWAYCSDNKRTFLRLYAYRNKDLKGYIHIDLSDPYVARLVDFAEVEAGVIQVILDEARKKLNGTNHSVIHASYNFKNPQLRTILKSLYKFGFIPINREGNFCLRPIKFIDMNILGDIHLWYLTEAWHTLYKDS